MIIKWPLLWQFNGARDIILKSRTDVKEMGDDDDDDVQMFKKKQRYLILDSSKSNLFF